jgi:CheY-like chemotaxis protein
VILAKNGFHAFDLLKKVQPDLFLFDHHLPGIDGLELYQWFHAHGAFATIPVLFLSANAPKEAFEKQHLFCVSKPFEVENLLQKVDMLLTA